MSPGFGWTRDFYFCAMTQASLFAPEAELLPAALSDFFPGLETAGSHHFRVARKIGWFRSTSLDIYLRTLTDHEADLSAMLLTMRGIVAELPAQQPEKQQALLQRIETAQLALAFSSDSLSAFEDDLFRLATRLNGFLLVDRVVWYDGHRNLLIDNMGYSGR